MLIVMHHKATDKQIEAVIACCCTDGFDGQAHPRERADRNRGPGE